MISRLPSKNDARLEIIELIKIYKCV